MKVEFLFFEGCPHGPLALERLEQVIERMAPGTAIAHVRVESDELAQQVGFLGSPSIRVDGLDIEGLTSGAPGMACRLYDGGGPPAEWMIEAAVLRAMGPKHVLFMCVANSARSQMAEGIARTLAPASVRISSAGSSPTSVRPEALQVLSEIGIDIADHHSKSVDDVDKPSVDVAITLCADEVCPLFPHPITRLHWGLTDPAAVEGGADARFDAFRQTRDELSKRLERLFAVPQ